MQVPCTLRVHRGDAALRPAHGISVVIGSRVLRAVARDEVVTQRKLGVPRTGVFDDVDVPRDHQLSRPERPHDPALGLPARADEIARLGHVIAIGHFAIGDEEIDALAGLGDPL